MVKSRRRRHSQHPPHYLDRKRKVEGKGDPVLSPFPLLHQSEFRVVTKFRPRKSMTPSLTTITTIGILSLTRGGGGDH